MKNLILTLLFILSASLTFGQKLVTNEVDEFTGNTIMETSWEVLNRKSKLSSYVRFRKIDNRIYLNFRMTSGYGSRTFSVDEGEVLYFKFSDDEILKLSNTDYQLTTIGGGTIGLLGSHGVGLELTCRISQEILAKLSQKTLDKVRVYTSIGYVEAEVKRKRAETFKELARLIN
tara:strand:- start:71472 stop:71993 length:522 start_codon:yes stop_codon:yes gene_type:complete